MSKILIVPDVHGRSFWHKAEELINSVDKVVFLGDYLDPYRHEEITFDTALEEFDKILEFKDKYGDKIVMLVGNHDCHYINTSFMDCSRLNYLKRQDIHELYMKHIDKFQLIWEFDTWLFSHAGVYEEWMEACEFTLDDLRNFEEFRKDKFPSLACLSFYRGGWNRTGSCVWADLRESLKHKLLEGYHHIVGHTQLESELYKADTITCVDVRRCFILDTETGEIADA
jgi:predicted MPP superfamily phosphohydrolase